MPVNVFKQDSHSLLLEPGINQLLLLLLLLSRFSRVQLCMTPWTAAHQAPPSMGFSRQECWSGVPLPSPAMYDAAAAAKARQSCPTLCDPIDGSPMYESILKAPRAL